MKYVVFYKPDGAYIGYLPTITVKSSYDGLDFLVLRTLPTEISNTPADKLIYIDVVNKKVILVNKPPEDPKPATAEEEIEQLKRSVAELTAMLISQQNKRN
ncbi:hypothetical protein [Paenibacillus arenosi]|uniref:DUF3006 domain-containing protein n=1 Tax=Paenibacillus arenosi TaxID=2774142 RepID=A0ABR9B1G8_9BACL|nr:hypothetical protein [Paenibacillus arenosi]MBD8499976.1 hypothetical protein [Paenibacillus arenosi]